MAATVLVVEDERKLRELVRSYLERAGFTVLSTGSGAEAITMAAGQSVGRYRSAGARPPSRARKRSYSSAARRSAAGRPSLACRGPAFGAGVVAIITVS
jgi:CheY-like chemotaxis protein